MRAPILSSFSRMVPQVAVASLVPASPMRRTAPYQHVGEGGEPQLERAVGVDVLQDLPALAAAGVLSRPVRRRPTVASSSVPASR